LHAHTHPPTMQYEIEIDKLAKHIIHRADQSVHLRLAKMTREFRVG
jgi:hypothetical protein